MSEQNNLRLWTLVPFIGLCAAVIAIGQAFPPGAWYASLNRPSFSPPNWLFGVVWTPLYCMIAVAGWLLWERARRTPAMAWWFIQLTLNAAWSWIFFGIHEITAALVEIMLLWLAIGATIIGARRAAPAAAWLLAPYWVWVAFAAVLNFAYWRLN